ncbi:hypothetical protein NDU88_011179 [Pleurodeles waltl]|uniref:Uncharacterized protein n=1 Tax=Pleurodeles waltl TaxID=8319 RepID=A0AAV7QY30_PLEWA|nr:hypothetical protein NDU88_011179 [Pleurodeles waltl]
MEGSEPRQGAVSGEEVAQIGRIQWDPNSFQVWGELQADKLDTLGPSVGEGSVVQCTKGMPKDGVQTFDLNDEQGFRGVNQQPGTSLGHHLSIPPQGIDEHQSGSAEEPLGQSIAGMLTALSLEVRAGFETSNANQKEIRGLCETLGGKIDELAGRTAALEEEVGDLRVPSGFEGELVRLCQSEIRAVLDKSLLGEISDYFN